MSTERIHQRIILHSEPDFDVSFHIVDIGPCRAQLMTFIHLDVYYWSPSTMKRMLALWPLIRERLPGTIFCQPDTYNSKFTKFIRLFGWKYLGPCLCSDGADRPVYFQKVN